MNIRAVLFDLWGTLILDHESVSRPRQLWRAENVRSVLQRYGLELALEAVDAALVHAGAALSRLHDAGGEVDSAGRVTLFLEELAPDDARLVPTAARPELEEAITSMHPVYRPVLAEGAVEVLRQIKAIGLATALVSNAGLTTAPHLREMLANYGLTPFLDVLVFSDELGLAKPDRRIFQAALKGLRVAATDAAFLGDSPHNDIFGAKAVGLFAVQIGLREHTSRSGYSEHPGAEPDARIEHLGQLLPALGL